MPSYIRGRHLFGARERKDMRLCWDNRRAPKRYTMAGEFENTLRESMGILCTHENVFRPLHPRPRHKLWQHMGGICVADKSGDLIYVSLIPTWLASYRRLQEA